MYQDDDPEDPRRTPIAARALFRRRGRWPVTIEGDDEDRFAIDLSVGGLFLRDVSSYTHGTHLVLIIGLVDGVLTTGATVRWVRPERLGPMLEAGMGLLFDDLSDADRDRITNEIEPGEER